MTPVRVAVVITALNGLEMTKRLLGTIPAACGERTYAIMVVDDASIDDTAEYLRAWTAPCEWFHMIRNICRSGYLVSANKGMDRMHALYPDAHLLLLNNDVELRAGAVDSMARELERDPTVGIVGAKLLYPDGKIQHAGAYLDKNYDGRHDGQHISEQAYEDVTATCEKDYVTMACALISAELYETIGGYDPLFAPMYYEDPDYCYRAREAGYGVIYCPWARAVHHETVTNRREYGTAEVEAMVARNKKKFMTKWRTRR